MVNARIVAKRENCIGSGQCVFADPEAFDQDDEGTVMVLQPEPANEAALALAKQAVNVCPSRTLSLVLGDGS